MNMMTRKGDSSVSNNSPIVQSVAINSNLTPNVVGRSESNMEFNYEAFNTTLTSIEGVPNFFEVPLKTQVNYENFANGIEMGTYKVWSKLTSKQRKAILKTASVGWTTLMKLKLTTPDLGSSSKTFTSVLNPGLGVAEKPKIGDDFTKETIRVEYKWRPPKYDACKIFGHLHDHCPKKEASPPIVSTSDVVTPTVKKTNDGFKTVGKKKKRKGKSKSTNGGQFVSPLEASPPIVSTSDVVTPTVKKTNDGFKTVGKKRRGKGATNLGNPSKLRNTGTSFNKDNITSPNSFSALNVKEGEKKK
nr:zinc knuckle CX2CX4HX4C [Tanacetum cinerariifolium]